MASSWIKEFLSSLGADITARSVLPKVMGRIGSHIEKRYLTDDSSAHFVLEELVKGYPDIAYPILWGRYCEAVDKGEGDRLDRAFTKIAATIIVTPEVPGVPATPSPVDRKERIRDFLETLELFPRTEKGDKDFERALMLLETNRLQELAKKLWIQGKKIVDFFKKEGTKKFFSHFKKVGEPLKEIDEWLKSESDALVQKTKKLLEKEQKKMDEAKKWW